MLHLSIQKESKDTFIKQIYQQIRHMILKGDLKANEKLPSTRALAKVLNVSRNTVVTAYEMLSGLKQQGLTLVAKCLLSPDSEVWIDEAIKFIGVTTGWNVSDW